MSSKLLGAVELDGLQRDTFAYFLEETNPRNGLVPDSTRTGAPSSIAAVGFALAAYAAGAERRFLTRAEAIKRVLATLRFFWESPQGEDRDATGYQGFFYHFLDMQTGRRAWDSELSTIDTTFLLAGALAAATYFGGEAKDEREISKLADALYRRVDWRWAQNGSLTVAHAWKPGRGFLKARWEGYSEAISCTCWAWDRRRTRCRRAATRRGHGRTAGRSSTVRSSCTPGRSSFTSSRTSG